MAAKKEVEDALIRLVKAVEADSSNKPTSNEVMAAVQQAKMVLPNASWTD